MKATHFSLPSFVRIYSSTCILLSALVVSASLGGDFGNSLGNSQLVLSAPTTEEHEGKSQPGREETLSNQSGETSSGQGSPHETPSIVEPEPQPSAPLCGYLPISLGIEGDRAFHQGNLEEALSLYQQSQREFIDAECIDAAVQTQIAIDRIAKQMGKQPVEISPPDGEKTNGSDEQLDLGLEPILSP